MKKSNLHVEEAKERRTSHWDLDLLSHEELEELMVQDKQASSANAEGEDKGTGEAPA